ncbi:MAG: hypothetical protein K8R59_14960 [Thermoanaerobaculales bacterium]|nr:hypothetical protein [Thermoanaerobaculales bacterium]
MGVFYTNFSLQDVSADDVVRFLRDEGKVGVICPERNGWVAISLEETEGQHPLLVELAAKSFSQAFGCVVFAVLNHDDDVLAYWLANKGEVSDRYVSHPGLLEGRDDPPEGGDSRVLSKIIGRPEAAAELDVVLSLRGIAECFSALEHHAALVRMLGLPPFTVGLDSSGNSPMPDELDESEIIEVF